MPFIEYTCEKSAFPVVDDRSMIVAAKATTTYHVRICGLRGVKLRTWKLENEIGE
jgi:hypothetical protein